MRLFSFLLFFIALFGLLIVTTQPTYSDKLDDITKELNDLTKSLDMSVNATKPLESQLNALKSQIADIKSSVAAIEQDVAIKKKNIDDGYKNLAKQQSILEAAIGDYYIKSYYSSPLLTLLSIGTASEITQVLAYQKAAADQDKAIIANIAVTLDDLETKKENLEYEQSRLITLKTTLDEQSGKLDGVVKGAKAYQATLSSKIAQLSAQQRQLLAQKLGNLNLPSSLGAGPLQCVDDRKLDPGFSPRFAFFTFGIPHRIGMNQYGAHGRANAGQNYEQILQAYYNNFSFETRNARIKVQGHGEYDLEEYVKRIYEMPNSFHIEALKAQAIAARSYALAYTNNGEKEICTTQSCQVFQPGPKGGPWEQAVNETAGKVMVSEGQVITAWYASTAGGYTFQNNDVWGGGHKSWTKRMRDTNGDVGSIGDLISKSYDKDSPCLYSAQGFRSEFTKSAWLKANEIADIANVILLARADSSTKEKLYQVDKSHPYGGEVWNHDKVRSELSSRNITPYNNVDVVTTSNDFGSGITNTVSVSGDAGTNSFSGSEFKDFFNLRAPANIQIVGPLFNIEKQ